MDQSESAARLPTFADKVFGQNPFSKNDPRHELWETIVRLAAEENARLEAKMLGRAPSEEHASEEYVSWVLDYSSGRFDILAKSLLVLMPVVFYEQALARLVEFEIASADKNCPSFVSRALLLSELRLRLSQRKAHWTAEAFKLTREEAAAVERGADSAAATSGEKPKHVRHRKKQKLTAREEEILEILKSDKTGKLRGIVYCAALKQRDISPRQEWIGEGCPTTYPEAYRLTKWEHRIQDEKYRVSQFLPRTRRKPNSPRTSSTRRRRVNL